MGEVGEASADVTDSVVSMMEALVSDVSPSSDMYPGGGVSGTLKG